MVLFLEYSALIRVSAIRSNCAMTYTFDLCDRILPVERRPRGFRRDSNPHSRSRRALPFSSYGTSRRLFRGDSNPHLLRLRGKKRNFSPRKLIPNSHNLMGRGPSSSRAPDSRRAKGNQWPQVQSTTSVSIL